MTTLPQPATPRTPYPAPPRALFLSEGVLSHAVLQQRLQVFLADEERLRPSFETVLAPNRAEAWLIRPWKRLGDLDLQPLRWRLRYSWQSRRMLDRRRGDHEVLFVNTQACALLLGTHARLVPTVISVDTTSRQFARLEYWRPRDRFSFLSEGVIERLERRVLRQAAAVVAWTDWTAASLRHDYGVDERRVVRLHPGVDAALFGSQAEPSRPRGEPLQLLFVGNGVRRKGLPLLLEALPLVGRPVELHVVTSDEVEPRAGLRVHRGLGPDSDGLLRRYAEADMFVFPTQADAVPWVVLEAMAAGLPVVSTAVGAVPELLGDAGVIVRSATPAALARAIRELADDPQRCQRLGRLGLDRVAERYDVAMQLPRLIDLLRETAERGAREAT